MKTQKKDTNIGMRERPPIVTVMGHIDHGKTTLLDKIRQTNIALQEIGGITQKIGAYQIEVTTSQGDKEKITFIDTPGHAAFAQMRARGVKVTDIAVLVVAADEGVKPQTKECLAHINQAKIPFIVAINKIDLPQASVERVKGELAQEGVVVEDYGGNIPMVPVSAKTGQGIKELLEMIILMAKVIGFKANPSGNFEGVVIESSVDPKKGPIATIIVKNGTLKPKDKIYLGQQGVKIRAMFDENGKPVWQAPPSKPVEVLGFTSPPPAGAVIKDQPFVLGAVIPAAEKEKDSFQDLFKPEEIKLPVIIKADIQGSLEAILHHLPKEVEIVFAGIGEVNESDIFLAQTSKAKIFAFNVKVSPAMERIAEESGIVIRKHKIIYDLFDEIEKAVLKLMEPMIDQEILGKAKILEEFSFEDKRVIGCQVIEGKLTKKVKVHLVRDGQDLGEARIASMRRGKQDVEETSSGNDCGIILQPQLDFKIGDMLISYK